MKKELPEFELKDVVRKLPMLLHKIKPYSLAIFIVFVACLYGFLLLRIHTLNTAEPSQDSVTSQVQAAHIPHIDPQTIQQLQSLQDNSVNVQALFNQARNNPFQ
jgi:hypothetical protein